MRSSVALQFLWGSPGNGATQLPGIGSGDGAEHVNSPLVLLGRGVHFVHDGASAQSASRVQDWPHVGDLHRPKDVTGSIAWHCEQPMLRADWSQSLFDEQTQPHLKPASHF